jgi:hypothetical protein
VQSEKLRSASPPFVLSCQSAEPLHSPSPPPPLPPPLSASPPPSPLPPLQFLKNMYVPRQLQHISAQCVRAGLLPATHAAVTGSGLPSALQRLLNGWASKQRKSASEPGDQALLDAATHSNATAVAWIVGSHRQLLGLSAAGQL